MFHFWYNKEGEVGKFSMILGFAVAALALAGAVFLARPSMQVAQKLIKSWQGSYRLIVIQPDDCKDCFDIYQVPDFIKDAKGIKIKKAKEYKASSVNADLLIKTYKIKNLPTFILQGDVKSLVVSELFDETNIAFTDDKTFVYSNHFAPFYNLDEKKVRGEFNLTYITDLSCAKCYDVSLHDRAMENLVMKPVASSTADIAMPDGKKLISDYKITSVPTIILQGDLDAYQDFDKLWKTVGTIEKDGAYVFREEGLKLMGVYKNLKNGSLMNVVK